MGNRYLKRDRLADVLALIQVLALDELATHDQRLFFYPDSFAIIENNGMYREITMPPMLTPSRPMMTGSSMASMSLVAASTSSS